MTNRSNSPVNQMRGRLQDCQSNVSVMIRKCDTSLLVHVM